MLLPTRALNGYNTQLGVSRYKEVIRFAPDVMRHSYVNPLKNKKGHLKELKKKIKKQPQR